MRKYHFTGHLNPLPPGITCGLQLSGDVYLPSEVDAQIAQMEQRHRDEVTRLHRQITKLRGQLDNQRRKRAAKT